MLTTVQFPEFSGLSWGTKRTAIFNTVSFENRGMASRAGRYLQPVYQWSLSFDILRDNDTVTSEYKELTGFFIEMGGRRDSFLLLDTLDYQVIDGFVSEVTDGSQSEYQLVIERRSFLEVVQAIDLSEDIVISVNDTPLLSSEWDVNAQGVLTIDPANLSVGDIIKATFTFFHRVEFASDQQEIEEFLSGRHRGSVVLRTRREI